MSHSNDVLYQIPRNPSDSFYRIPRDELHRMLEEENLDKIETYLCQVEEGIFDGAPLSAQKIEEYLQCIVSLKNIETMRKKNLAAIQNDPWKQALVDAYKKFGRQNLAIAIETGQLPDSESIPLSEEKNRCQETFDEISEAITAIKERLKTKRLRDNRIVSYLERMEKCENEIRKISGIMERF